MLEAAGYPPETATRRFHVPGMNCQGCVKRMREAIQAEDDQ
ncbi:heavy-metal-associated domain-containing protein, partial [Chromohalobacter israelensis]